MPTRGPPPDLIETFLARWDGTERAEHATTSASGTSYAASSASPCRTRQLTAPPAATPPRISAPITASIVLPAMIADAGDQAARRFFARCEYHRLGQLADIGSLHVAANIKGISLNFSNAGRFCWWRAASGG